jgi:hypothetical protein
VVIRRRVCCGGGLELLRALQWRGLVQVDWKAALHRRGAAGGHAEQRDHDDRRDRASPTAAAVPAGMAISTVLHVGDELFHG